MGDGRSSGVPKIVHFIWSVPHYRRPIFQRLSGRHDIDFIVCAGSNPKMFGDADIKIVTTQNGVDNEFIKMHLIRSCRMKRGFFKDFEWQPGAVSFLLNNDFDAVICLGNKSFSNLLIRLICKVKKIPLLEWTQGVKRPEKGMKWFIYKMFYKLADGLLLYGSRARDFFVANGFDGSNLFVVNNSLDFDSQIRIRDNLSVDDIIQERIKFNVQQDDRLIFFSGRLEKRSNLVFLFEALKILKGKNLNIRLVVIGDGSCMQKFVAAARMFDVQNSVVFLGACYDENSLAKIMMAADLCVIPGPVGLTAIHSLVYGTPVLARDAVDWTMPCGEEKYKKKSFFDHGPEIEAVRKGVTGDFYEQDNVHSLASKIETMLYPVPCKACMVEACKQVIETSYTPAFQEKVIIKALNSVLSGSKKISEKINVS